MSVKTKLKIKWYESKQHWSLLAIGIYIGALIILWIEYFRGSLSLIGTTLYTFMTPPVLISVYYIRKSIYQRNIYKLIFIIGVGLSLGFPIWGLISFILIGATWSPFYEPQGILRIIIFILTIVPSYIVAAYIFYKLGKKRDFRSYM
jgi:hypothetical protein